MWQHAGTMLAVATQTAISDASRMAKFAQLEARPHTTWIRVARTPCCDRCAILAGKRANYRMDFQRHPGCDCDAIPISEETSDLYKQWVFDSQDYFDSLSVEKQNKTFTKAGAQAIRDGADINQVVNARRGMATAGESFSQRRWITTEGTTKRGLAAARLREQYDSFIRGPSVNRLTPHAIYQIAKGNRDVSRKLLIANGYLLDEPFYPPDTLPWVEKKLLKKLSEKPSKKQPKKQSKKPSKKPLEETPTDPATLMKRFIEDRKSYDGRVPFDHIIVGKRKKKTISGAHSWERRQWVVEQVKQGAQLPPEGKTFFPQLKGGDEALRAWLGDENRGIVRDVLQKPDRLEKKEFGWGVHGIVETPDGHKIELVLALGDTGEKDPRNFKINSVYPARGQGVSEVLEDGTIRMKDFDGGADDDT